MEWRWVITPIFRHSIPAMRPNLSAGKFSWIVSMLFFIFSNTCAARYVSRKLCKHWTCLWAFRLNSYIWFATITNFITALALCTFTRVIIQCLQSNFRQFLFLAASTNCNSICFHCVFVFQCWMHRVMLMPVLCGATTIGWARKRNANASMIQQKSSCRKDCRKIIWWI